MITDSPNADEKKWPANITAGEKTLDLDAMENLMELTEVEELDDDYGGTYKIRKVNLGAVIIPDEPRKYLCTVCGRFVTEAHHIHPENCRVIYHGESFYLERHVCVDCMRIYKKKSDALSGYPVFTRSGT